jgi:hypothetical protein
MLVKCVSQEFFNATPRTGQSVVLFIAPFSKSRCLRRTFTRVVMMVSVLSAFGVLGATVLTEPAVAEVEEMGGLMHFPNDADFMN